MSIKNLEQFGEWQRKADEDFGSAELLLKNNAYPAIICFHAHQVVEKYLKGYLAYHDFEPQKTHQLDMLILKVSKIEEDLKDYKEEAMSLNNYYIETRYPADLNEGISMKEAKTALEIADKIRKLVFSKIKTV
jgi:HEPN domain-containing protein